MKYIEIPTFWEGFSIRAPAVFGTLFLPGSASGSVPRQYAVTFIDNHDTGSTQRHWPFPDDKVRRGLDLSLA